MIELTKYHVLSLVVWENHLLSAVAIRTKTNILRCYEVLSSKQMKPEILHSNNFLELTMVSEIFLNAIANRKR